MRAQDLLPDGDAAALVGVALNTLQRFAEAGYLQVHKDSSGIKLYSRAEISGLFGIKQSFTNGHHGRKRQNSEPLSEFGDPMMDDLVLDEPPPANAEMQKSAAQPAVAQETAGQLEQEIAKLKSVIALQEKLLDMRELELADLKNERNWLKARIEKLEEKSDREQLLLLSETQTIRQLLQVQQRKKSAMHYALEWLGLVAPEAPPRATTVELLLQKS